MAVKKSRKNLPFVNQFFTLSAMSHEFSVPVPPTPIVHCRHCRYWDAHMTNRPTSTPEGLCRRHAPHPALLDEVRDSGTSWPRTFEDDWCGEGESADPA